MKPQTLKSIRKRLQMTQIDMANLVQVSAKTWQSWENGTNPMHIAFAKLLEQQVKEKLQLPCIKKVDRNIKKY